MTLSATASAISSKDIGRQHRTYKISKMRDIVHVGQSASDKDVALTRLGEDRSLGLLRFFGHIDPELAVGGIETGPERKIDAVVVGVKQLWQKCENPRNNVRPAGVVR